MLHERYRTDPAPTAVDDTGGRPPYLGTMDRVPHTVAVRHPLDRWLRARVIALREATRRRVFPAGIELVAPAAGAEEPALAAWAYAEDAGDHGLRVDVLVRLLTDCACRGVPALTLVHVRPGPHEPGDLDLAWLSAARVAGPITGVEVPTVVVVSRWGWLDLTTDAQRSWVRARRRS